LRIGGEIVAARRGVSDGVRGAVRAADGDGMVSVGFFSWRLRRVRSDKPRTTGPTVGAPDLGRAGGSAMVTDSVEDGACGAEGEEKSRWGQSHRRVKPRIYVPSFVLLFILFRSREESNFT
jgi:hypothetical protein